MFWCDVGVDYFYDDVFVGFFYVVCLLLDVVFVFVVVFEFEEVG